MTWRRDAASSPANRGGRRSAKADAFTLKSNAYGPLRPLWCALKIRGPQGRQGSSPCSGTSPQFDCPGRYLWRGRLGQGRDRQAAPAAAPNPNSLTASPGVLSAPAAAPAARSRSWPPMAPPRLLRRLSVCGDACRPSSRYVGRFSRFQARTTALGSDDETSRSGRIGPPAMRELPRAAWITQQRENGPHMRSVFFYSPRLPQSFCPTMLSK
jgi:hypothetical protein